LRRTALRKARGPRERNCAFARHDFFIVGARTQITSGVNYRWLMLLGMASSEENMRIGVSRSGDLKSTGDHKKPFRASRDRN
jgi:hypothetical protein